MKRTPLVRRTGLNRRQTIRKIGGRRSGLSGEQRATLKALHREIVMLRAGVGVRRTNAGAVGYYGPCERCHRPAWLSVCHILSQGAHPAMRFDPDNAWAGCWRCHLGPGSWHKDPDKAMRWIEEYRGKVAIEALRMRSQHPQKYDFMAKKLYLEALRDRLKGHEVSHILIQKEGRNGG